MDGNRALRRLKRLIKRIGNKRRRRFLKRRLEEDPDDAHADVYSFEHDSSRPWNGKDRDRKRRSAE
jgi:hypothetical protein